MRISLTIDDALMNEALRLSGAGTRRRAIELALQTMVRLRRQEQVRSLRGIGWEGDLDESRRDDPDRS
jgi:Arc/MetJ family transcription regulator